MIKSKPIGSVGDVSEEDTYHLTILSKVLGLAIMAFEGQVPHLRVTHIDIEHGATDTDMVMLISTARHVKTDSVPAPDTGTVQ